MNGALLAEYGLKGFLILIAVCFLFVTGSLLFGLFVIMREKAETKNEKEDKFLSVVMILLLSIFCGLAAATVFGVATMPWWA